MTEVPQGRGNTVLTDGVTGKGAFGDGWLTKGERMDGSVRAQGSAVSWAEQMAEQLAAGERRLRELLELQQTRLEELQRQLEAAEESARRRQGTLQEQLAALEAEREALQNQLKGAPGPRQTNPVRQGYEGEAEEIQQRYELALEDIRRLQAENQELRLQLEKIASAENVSGQGPEESWEAFKRRVLESLEAENKEAEEPIDETRRQERVQIQEVIAKTEEALAAKDRELEAMRHLLENQSANLGAMAVGAAAVGELLDQDEIIRQQRETLQRLEAEWREKLRQAEVELSLERAALARQRAELEEKLRQIEELQAQGPSASVETASKKPPGGWRNFFGLNEGRKK